MKQGMFDIDVSVVNSGCKCKFFFIFKCNCHGKKIESNSFFLGSEMIR